MLRYNEKPLFLKALLDRKDCPYVWPNEANRWSGRDLPNALYPRTYDCSGLINACLYEATGGRIDHRGDWGAGHQYDHCTPITDVNDIEPGDLCFYGSGPHHDQISHVMAMIWTPDLKWQCYGASGGDHTVTSPEIAKSRQASVRGYPSALYRRDFVGYGRLLG